jgi:predicted HTH domain antitoxin
MQDVKETIAAYQDNAVPVTVNVPRELLADVGLSAQTASAEILRAFVLSLYRRDRISSGKAAQLLGMHRMTFIRVLAEEKIPYLDYTPEELEAEIRAVHAWSNQPSDEVYPQFPTQRP